MKASTTQQLWNAGQIPLTKPKVQPTSWWTEPGTRQAFMDRAKVEQQTRMQFATVTGISANPIGYWPTKAGADV